MSKCRMWTKKTTSEKWKINSNKKLGLEWAVNELWKHIRKKSDPKNRKNSKKQSEKNSRRKTTRFFAPFPVSAWPKSLLQFDFKNHENVWTDLKKKDSAPIQFKFFEL